MSETERDRAPQGVSDDELAAERGVELPDREALSVVDPHAGGGLLRPYPPFVRPHLWPVDPPPLFIDPAEPTTGPR